MSLAAEPTLSPIQRRWQKVAGEFLATSILIAAGLTFGTIAFWIVVAIMLVMMAYLIAQGASPTARDLSRDDADRAWADGVLAVPLLVEAAATLAEWMLIGVATVVIATSPVFFFSIGVAALVDALLFVAPLAAAGAIALTARERLSARRTLERLAGV